MGDPSLFLVRHGQTEWSAGGQHTSRTEQMLTEAGREQARRLAPLLAGRDFALVLTSPRRRAVDTAELAGVDQAAERDPNLTEWDYGDFEGLTTSQIREQVPGWTVWTDPSPNGEQVEHVAARVDAVIDRCRRAAGEVLLVAHGHVLRVLTARWLGMGPTDGRLFRLDPATLSELGHEHETPVISRWNVEP